MSTGPLPLGVVVLSLDEVLALPWAKNTEEVADDAWLQENPDGRELFSVMIDHRIGDYAEVNTMTKGLRTLVQVILHQYEHDYHVLDAIQLKFRWNSFERMDSVFYQRVIAGAPKTVELLVNSLRSFSTP